MPNPTSLLVATAFVAIPSTAGIYHLATSSSTKTTEQEETNEERKAQETEVTKDPVGSETEQPPVINEKPDAQAEQSLIQENPKSDTPPESIPVPDKTPQKPWLEDAKSKLTELNNKFPYEEVIKDFKGRPGAFDNFVNETDKIRTGLASTISEFLKQQENQSRNWNDIFEQDLGFKLILESESSIWEKLVTIRSEEAEAQTDLDHGVSRTKISPLGDEVTKESIMNFCQEPSKSNSHLGKHSPKRTDQEKANEYRFFTYYSYCTKESYYLDSRLKFDESVN